jgi:hypothetical protein
MNAPLAPAHSPFGGSVAARVLRCPASVGLVEKVPPYLRKSSAYVDRGTALHTAMTLLIDEKETLESLAGKVIGNYAVTADDVDDALRPVFTYIAELLDTLGAEYYLEYRVAFGPFRYAGDTSTSAIVLAYAVGDAPAVTWHADGAILDWNKAPDELRAAYDRGTTFAAWNAGFDSLVWNYATLGFPLLPPERVIDVMVQAGVSNLPTDLENASRYLGGEGKQKDGKKLIKLFCVEGADPREHPEEWQRFLAYARQDVTAMREVYHRTRPLPLAEWREYQSFENVILRGVTLDMPFVLRAEALAAEDAVASGRRLTELTGKAVTRVTQAKRIATWLHEQLPDAAMREVLTVGVPADDDDADDEDEAEPRELSLTRDRVANVLARLDAKRANGGLDAAETKAHEVATLRLYGAGASPKKFARLAAQQVDGVLRGQYRFSGAGRTGRLTSRGRANSEFDARRARRRWRRRGAAGRCDRRRL